MAKTKTLSTAKKPEELQPAYMKAVQAVKKAGFSFATKKPDEAKVGPAMGKKTAEFQLIQDGKLVRLAVVAGPLTSVLGFYDTTSEKEATKRLVALSAMQSLGMDYSSEIKKLQAEIEEKRADPKNGSSVPGKKGAANKGPDPAEAKKLIKAAEGITKEITSYRKTREEITKMGFPAVLKSSWSAQFIKYCKDLHVEENLDFLKEAGKDAAYLKKTYIDDGAPKQINIDSGTVDKIAKGAHPKIAAPIVVRLVESDTMPKWRGKMTGVIDKLIKEKQDEVAVIDKRLNG